MKKRNPIIEEYYREVDRRRNIKDGLILASIVLLFVGIVKMNTYTNISKQAECLASGGTYLKATMASRSLCEIKAKGN